MSKQSVQEREREIGRNNQTEQNLYLLCKAFFSKRSKRGRRRLTRHWHSHQHRHQIKQTNNNQIKKKIWWKKKKPNRYMQHDAAADPFQFVLLFVDLSLSLSLTQIFVLYLYAIRSCRIHKFNNSNKYFSNVFLQASMHTNKLTYTLIQISTMSDEENDNNFNWPKNFSCMVIVCK